MAPTRRSATPRTLSPPDAEAARGVIRRLRREADALRAAYERGLPALDERFAARIREADATAEAQREVRLAVLDAAETTPETASDPQPPTAQARGARVRDARVRDARIRALEAIDREARESVDVALGTAEQDAAREYRDLARLLARSVALDTCAERLLPLLDRPAGLALWDRPALDALRLLGELPPRADPDAEMVRAKDVEGVFRERLGVSRAQYYRRYHGLLTPYALSGGLAARGSRADLRWAREEAEALARHLGAGDLGAGDLGAGDLGAGDLGAGDLGAGDLGAGDLGAGDLGAGDLGAGDLGSARPGSAESPGSVE